MRLRRTPAPHTSRPRATRLRGVVAALLAAPLALGTLAATALPAAAAIDFPHAPDMPTTVKSGEVFTATITCPNLGGVDFNGISWLTSEKNGLSHIRGTVVADVKVYTETMSISRTGEQFVDVDCITQTAGQKTVVASRQFPIMVESEAPVADGTTTAIRFAQSPVEPNNTIDVEAKVLGTSGVAQGGSVQFALRGQPVGSPVPLQDNGYAVASIPNPGAGTWAVTATYSGTEFYTFSTSTKDVRVKTKSIVTAVIPDRAQAPLTSLSAAVVQAPGLAAPTGTITFQYSEGAVLGKVALTDGTASLALPDLAPGYYEDVIAIYSGDENYGDGGSGYRDMIVDPAVPTTPIKNASVVTLDVPATITGTQVPVEVTVEPGMQWTSMGVAGVEYPEGTVEISLGKGGPLLKATLAQGTANVTFDGVAPGTYEVLAYYTGDKHFERSAGSATTTVTAPVVTPPVVTPPAAPAPDLSGSTSTLPVGGTITLVARDFLPGETVSFYLHSDPIFLGTAVADANGVATLVVAIPAGAPAGEHHVRATGATSLRTAEIPVTVTAAPVVTAPIVTVPVAVPVVTPVAAAPVAAAVPAVAAPLASTGTEIGSTVLLVSVLLGSGALLLAGRRRFAMSGR